MSMRVHGHGNRLGYTPDDNESKGKDISPVTHPILNTPSSERGDLTLQREVKIAVDPKLLKFAIELLALYDSPAPFYQKLEWINQNKSKIIQDLQKSRIERPIMQGEELAEKLRKNGLIQLFKMLHCVKLEGAHPIVQKRPIDKMTYFEVFKSLFESLLGKNCSYENGYCCLPKVDYTTNQRTWELFMQLRLPVFACQYKFHFSTTDFAPFLKDWADVSRVIDTSPKCTLTQSMNSPQLLSEISRDLIIWSWKTRQLSDREEYYVTEKGIKVFLAAYVIIVRFKKLGLPIHPDDLSLFYDENNNIRIGIKRNKVDALNGLLKK